jgi:DNA-binding NarL/FixJ family response regulator
MSITVAIIEDEARVRDHMSLLISEAPGFRCLGAYSSGEQALREVPRQPPDVALMDINLGRMSGIECTFRLKRVLPGLQIVMLTVYEDSEKIFQALEMGATGYLLKRTPGDKILEAIAEVYRGGAPMSSHIARRVVQSFSRPAQPNRPSLAPREQEVLALVAKGYVNKEIATSLGLTLETVRWYLKSVYEKLHVRSRTEAAMKFFGPEKTTTE